MSETSSEPKPTVLTRMTAGVGNMPSTLKDIALVLAVFVVGGICGWIGRGVLVGPADVPMMNVYQDWRVFCPAFKDKDASCEMSQDVIDQKANQRVARLIMVRDKSKNMIVAVTVPLQVLLEPGMGLKIGSDQVRVYQYKTCTEEGCLSLVPMDDQVEAALSKAQNASVVVARPDGKAVEIPFSLKGYTDAYDMFLSNAAKRNSWWRRLWS